jgi:hypothetical protein
MSDNHLNFIESQLGIQLPATYRSAVNPFPLPASSWNHDNVVWDNPYLLIELNCDLRHFRGWPDWLFAIGQSEGDPSGYAIDVRSDPPGLWWIDHHVYDPNSGPMQQSFSDWFVIWVADAKNEVQAATQSLVGCFVAVLLIATFVVMSIGLLRC